MESSEKHSGTGTEELPAPVKTPRDIALELGPFNPPADFRFGPELESSAPRPIPERLKQGSYARSWRQRVFTSLAAAAACFLLSWNRFTQELSYYVLALGYLDYAGYALIAIPAVAALHRLLTGGRFAYLKNGTPVVARVLDSGIYSQGSKDVQTFGFATLVEYRHPETGEWTYQWIRTHRIDSTGRAHRYSTSVRVGDYVTAVGFPGRLETSLAIYGYLGLDPDQDYLQKDGQPVQAPPTWVVLGFMLLVTGIMGLAVLTLYVIEFLMPTGGSPAPAGIGAGAGAVACGLLGLFVRRGKGPSPTEAAGRKAPRRWRSCGVGLILGALAGFLVACALNAALDRSPPDLRDIKVLRYLQETWYPLFVRRYEIEYLEKDGGRRSKQSARLDTMAKFSLRLGVIDVGKGGLGMEWVRGIHPLQFRPVEPGQPAGKTDVTLEVKTTDRGAMTLVVKPVIALGEDKTLEPSEWLVERAREAVKARRKDGEAVEKEN